MRFRNDLPFDYGLCRQRVSVYHREGLTCRVLDGVHFEETVADSTEGAVTDRRRGFLLVVPYENDLQPGDRVCSRDGEYCTVKSVKQCTFLGRFCHTEARG